MPRGKRLDVAGVAQHVIQRGNDRQACFFRDGDYARHLGILREASLAHGCFVHAYVLMTNHVHLLMTPAHRGGVARVMQAVGRTYVRHVNDSSGRTGTLWEGRYKSSLVDSEQYVLACYRYIELNPVRAVVVDGAAGHAWSSHDYNALELANPLVSPHAIFLQIVGRAGNQRQGLQSIHLYGQRQQRLARTGSSSRSSSNWRRVAIGVPGRPRKPRPEKL